MSEYRLWKRVEGLGHKMLWVLCGSDGTPAVIDLRGSAQCATVEGRIPFCMKRKDLLARYALDQGTTG